LALQEDEWFDALQTSEGSLIKLVPFVVMIFQPRDVTSPEAIQDIVDSLKQALGADQPLSSSGEAQKT
jgi:hypothetical protein